MKAINIAMQWHLSIFPASCLAFDMMFLFTLRFVYVIGHVHFTSAVLSVQSMASGLPVERRSSLLSSCRFGIV